VYVLSLPEIASFLLLFVDDILLVANSMQSLNDVEAKLMQEFKMKDLGIKITRNEGVLHMWCGPASAGDESGGPPRAFPEVVGWVRRLRRDDRGGAAGESPWAEFKQQC